MNISDHRYKDKKRFGGNRLKALERDQYKCTICQSHDSLVVHHIDHSGQSENPNNELSNLQTLCRSCHSKVHAEEHPVNCMFCNKEFFVQKHDINSRKYCSKECCDKDKIGKQKTSYIVKCEVCNSEFKTTPYKASIGKGRYCSQSCSISVRKRRITMQCEWCNKEFESIPARIKTGRGRFCSHKCRGHFGKMMQLQAESIRKELKT